MRRAMWGAMGAMGAMLFSGAAAAQDDEGALFAERDAGLKERAAEVGKACGSAIDVAVDWPSFAAAMKTYVAEGKGSMRDATNNATGGCSIALGGIENVCSATYKTYGKAAVAQGVKKITCRYDGTVKGLSPAMEVNGGVIAMRATLNVGDNGDIGMALMRSPALPVPADEKTGALPMTVLERTVLEEYEAEQLTPFVEQVAERCGAPVAVTVDWAALVGHFRGKDDAKQVITYAGAACLDTATMLSALCRSDKTKAGVKKKLKSIRCTVLEGKAPKYKVSFDLKNGVATVRHNKGSANVEEQARKFIQGL